MSVIGTRRRLLTGAAAGLGLAAGACATRAPAAAFPAGFPTVADNLKRYVDEGRIAGAMVRIQGEGRDPVDLAYGRAALEESPAFGPDSVLRIFSQTKPITAFAAMQLIEQGKLGLDQPVADVLPAFAAPQVLVDGDPARTRPAAGPILVRHLMTHTAGLSYSINGPEGLAKLYRERGVLPGDPAVRVVADRPAAMRDMASFIQAVAALPLNADPGARYEYSIGLDVLGAVIEAVAGQPFATVLQQQIFDPLGMADTAFVTPEAARARMTSLYSVGENGLTLADDRARSAYFIPEGVPSGGGGLVSTTADYARFAAVQLGDGEAFGVRLLGAKTARLARSAELGGPHSEDWGRGLGAGMGVARTALPMFPGQPAGAFGWGGAAGTMYWVDPVNRFFAMLAVQHVPSTAYALRQETVAAVYRDFAAA